MAKLNRKKITIDNFTGGIGSDKYYSVPNGCYDGVGLDIRRGNRVILSPGSSYTTMDIDTNGSPITALGDYITTSGGRIFNSSGEIQYEFATTGYGYIGNYIGHRISGVDYTLFVSKERISRYAGNTALSFVLYSIAGDWIQSGNSLIHTIGNTTSLTGGAAVIGKRYKVQINTSNYTAGSIVVNFGGQGNITINSNGIKTFFVTATTTAGLVITPTSDFQGWISTSSTYTWLCNMEESYYTMDVSSSSSLLSPILEENGILYIANGNYLYTMDSFGVLTKRVVITEGYKIVAITKIGDQYLIWSRNNQGSKVYFWDGKTKQAQRTIYWYNELIMRVVNQGNYHIVITGGDFGVKKIWKSNGNNKVMLYKTVDSTTWKNRLGDSLLPPIPIYWGGSSENVYTNNSESFGDIVFIPGYSNIFIYGKKEPGFPDSMFGDITFPGDYGNGITAMYANNDELTYCHESFILNNYTISKVKLDNYESVQSNEYQFGSRGYITHSPIIKPTGKEKNGLRIKLGYRTPTNTYMNMYYRLDDEKNYYTFVCYTNTITVMPEIGAIYDYDGLTSGRFIVNKVASFGGHTYIETIETSKLGTPRKGNKLDKKSGIGDGEITYFSFHNFRYGFTITSTTEPQLKPRQFVRDFPYNFTEVQFREELVTNDGKKTPEINSFEFTYEEIPDDG